MKNKKAEIRIYVLLLIIYLVVLLLYFSPYIVDYLTSKPLNYIPWFRTTEPNSNLPETLRYNIITDKVEYSDGISWIPFPYNKLEDWNQKVKVGTKNITHGQARFYFADNYFFNYEKRTKERIPLTGQISGIIYKNTENPHLYPIFYCIFFKISRSGDIVIDLLKGDKEKFFATGEKNCTGIPFGIFYLKPENKLFFTGIDQKYFEKTGHVIIKENPEEVTDKWPSLYEEIAPQAAVWRDSVLQKPMCFCCNNNECKNFKVEKISNYPNVYLVADLTKPLSDCSPNE